jgi:hypothetical protein
MRHIYPNTNLGKAQAIRNLQWAIEDKEPWYMSCHYTTEVGNADICHFNNWILLATFDLACLAIKRATREIIFYQFNDTPLVNDQDRDKQIQRLELV